MTSAILHVTVIWPLATCDSLYFDHLAEPAHFFQHFFSVQWYYTLLVKPHILKIVSHFE